MALCGAAAYYYKSRRTLLRDTMIAMYEEYGYYIDDIKSISLSGIEGQQKFQAALEKLRQGPPN